MKIKGKVDHVPEKLSEEDFKQFFQHCADIKIVKHVLTSGKPNQAVLLVYCEGLADAKQINEYVLERLKMGQPTTETDMLNSSLDLVPVQKTEEIITRVFSGQLIIYHLHSHTMLALDIADPPMRTPEESSTELSIKGPRDGFVEDLTTNVALIRKRLRTNALRYEQLVIGKRSKSKVALLYIEEYVQAKWIVQAKERLKKLNVDSLNSSVQLENIIADQPNSLFPLMSYTGRPDYVVDCLSHGRFVILVDDAPMAIIAPVNLTFLLKSPEDIYMPFQIVALEMFIRLLGLITALLLPGFWVALTSYNMEQIPFPLLATVVLTRLGLPMPGPMEAFLLLGMFELFREAGQRLPKAIGHTMAVVGGIIVGDAVIRAGIASTTILIVAALTSVASFTIVNQSLNSSVTLIRLFVLLCASVLGMYGFILSFLAIVLYLARLESFGVPYLTPLSPLKLKDIWGAIFSVPLKYRQHPLDFLREKKPSNKGGDST